MTDGVGTVQTEFFTFGSESDPFVLDGGSSLPEVTVAYEIYGELNEAKDNVILLFHALTGGHHAAGVNTNVPGTDGRWTEEMHIGWWDDFIGPGRALNTDKFAIICANWLGHCYGTTGPASINPVTQKPYGGSFPRVTVGDTVRAHFQLLDSLGIDKLHAVVGGSVGGMMCLDAATQLPRSDAVRGTDRRGAESDRACTSSTTSNRSTPSTTTRTSTAATTTKTRRPTPAWRWLAPSPTRAFVSLEHMERTGPRSEVVGGANERVSSPLESYMWHQGQKFVQRFDANAYLRTMWMWQDFDLYRDAERRKERRLRRDAGQGRTRVSGLLDGLRCMLLPQSARRADGGAQSGGGAVQLDHSAHRKGPRLVPARGAPFRAASSLSLRIGMGSPVMDRG